MKHAKFLMLVTTLPDVIYFTLHLGEIPLGSHKSRQMFIFVVHI